MPVVSLSQELLPNPGFNEVNYCREYNMPCGPKGWFGVPIGAKYYIPGQGFDGRASLWFLVHDFSDPKQRTFLQTEILEPLRKDSSYIISMMIYGDCIDIGKLSVYMPEEDFLLETRPWQSIRPAVSYSNASQVEKTNKKYWVKLKLKFKATGKERYFVIGNFSTDENFPACSNSEEIIEYTIDNISLVPEGFTEEMKMSATRQAALYKRRERHEMLKEYISLQPPPPVKKKFRIDTLVIPDVLFAVNDSKIQKKTAALIDRFIDGIQLSKTDSIVVEGHTDNTGSLKRNQTLSLQRAESVKSYIAGRIPSPIIARGFDSQKPVTDNSTESGRQKNRRVVIYLYTRQKD